jgi:DNA-binding beta-propeller fold protein YncE
MSNRVDRLKFPGAAHNKRDFICKPYIFNFMKAELSGELLGLGIGMFARSCATAIFGALLLLSLPAKADDLYIADYNNDTVERIDSSGHSTVYLDDTFGLAGPMGVAFDGNGNLYVGSSGTLYATCNVNVLNKIDSSGNVSFFTNNCTIFCSTARLIFSPSVILNREPQCCHFVTFV